MIGRILSLLLAVVCVGTQAAGVALFDASNPLPLESAKALSPNAAQQIERAAKDKYSLGVLVVPLNPAALDADTIVVTIDGVAYAYAGSKECDGEGICVWKGSTVEGGTLTLAWAAASPGTSIRGDVREKRRFFWITPLVGHLMIEELDLLRRDRELQNRPPSTTPGNTERRNRE
jgi:hypothetical protein